MNQRQERIAGYIATCISVLAGSLAGAMIGNVLGESFFGTNPSNLTPALLFLGACMLIGAMMCCWLTLKSIRHPLTLRTTLLLLVFLPITGLALGGANLQSAGSLQSIVGIVAVALGIAAILSHFIAYRFQRQR